MLYSREVVDKLVSVNEVYFGDSPELQRVQESLSKFRAKFVGKFGWDKYLSKYNRDPDLYEFNRRMEEFFGFGAFSLIIEPSTGYNAYVFPIGGKVDILVPNSKQIVRTKSGIKYAKGTNYSTIVYMNSSLFMSSDFTDREIMAIILHEIGHCFAPSFVNTSTVLAYVNKFTNLIMYAYYALLALINPFGLHGKAVAGLSNTIQRKVIEIGRDVRNNNPDLIDSLYRVKGVFAGVEGTLTDILIYLSYVSLLLNPIQSGINRIYNVMQRILYNPVNIVKTFFGYQDEKISDNFASMYGYGADIASVTAKLSTTGGGYISLGLIKNDQFLNTIFGILTFPVDILLHPFSTHPESISRVSGQLKYLKRELNETADPKLVKNIEKEIKDIEKLLVELTKVVEQSDPLIIDKYKNLMLLGLFDGDIRNLISFDEKRYEEYDRKIKAMKVE